MQLLSVASQIASLPATRALEHSLAKRQPMAANNGRETSRISKHKITCDNYDATVSFQILSPVLIHDFPSIEWPHDDHVRDDPYRDAYYCEMIQTDSPILPFDTETRWLQHQSDRYGPAHWMLLSSMPPPPEPYAWLCHKPNISSKTAAIVEQPMHFSSNPMEIREIVFAASRS